MAAKKSLRVILVLVGVALAAFVAFAGEGEVGAAHEGGIPKIVSIQALNFFLLVILLVAFLKGKVATYFTQRHSHLSMAVEAAKRVKAEAEQRHREYTVKLERLESEGQAMLEQMRKEGEAIRQRIIEEAKKQAANIEREAKLTANNEIERAKNHIYDELLSMTIDGARGVLGQSVAEKDQLRLQKEFVAKIEAVQ